MSVEGRGFRGGDQAAQPAGQVGCEGDVARSIGAGFAPTGEGLAVGSWGAVGGARPAANGGGGGVCQASGGGGGANVGRGAQGGTSADGARHVGGLGGASTVFDPTRRAFFGGGGGGGAREGLTTRGGNGGGFIWVRARTLEAAINATFSVEGSNGEDGSGGAGGGAGGTLVLQALEVVANEAGLRAGGGAGGWVRLSNGFAGPGGGGGGGLIAAWTPRTWPSDATGGAGGVFRRLFPDGGEESQQGRNAGGGGLGRSDFTLQPFAVPDAGVDGGSLALLAPRDAEVLRARRPRVAGVGEPGTPVSLSLDGQPLATLAPGLDGAFEATPAVDLADGPHEVVAQQGARTVQRRFITDVGAPAAPLISSPRARAIFSESPGVVRGAVEAGARVRVFFDDAPEAGDVLADADGGFTFLVASALPDGDHTVSAVAEDAAGNVSERSEAVPFKVSSRLERPMDAMVRSGCEAAPAVSLLLGLLAWVARRRRRGA
ncbi:MAG: Ig-like domain-containing protein [Myxococcaceae bacterium]|nr:Ig-like domain-containing protein [Myxococcaceae bacterium]